MPDTDFNKISMKKTMLYKAFSTRVLFYVAASYFSRKNM